MSVLGTVRYDDMLGEMSLENLVLILAGLAQAPVEKLAMILWR